MADYLGLNWERDDLGGGKYRHTQYARPIAYPTNGIYEAITNGLVPTGVPAFPVGVDELLTTRFAAFTAGISPIWYAGYGLSMVQLSVVGCNNGVDAQWTQGENTIIYPEILDNADLTLTVANHLVQAAWRLKTGHPSTITWRMNENAGFDPDALTFGDDFFFSQPILKKAGETDIPLTWDVSQQGEIYGEKPENPTACGGGEWQSGGFGGGSPQGLFP